MNGTRELPPFRAELLMLSTDINYLMDARWYPVIGVSSLDLALDGRSLAAPGVTASYKPALQFAAVRPERPDAPALISAGSVLTAAGLDHYRETVSASTKTWFRVGVGGSLSGAAFGRVAADLHTAYRVRGELFEPTEVVFQPTNDVATPSVFPLNGEPLPTAGVDVARITLVILDATTSTMQWRLMGRAFNDPKARGTWVDLGSWTSIASGDSEVAPADISLSPLSLATKHYFETALAVRKSSDGATNCRAILLATLGIQFT